MEELTRQRAWLRIVLSTVLGFLLGVLGHILAVFIEKGSLCNVPTPFWIFIILLLTIVGIVAGVWLQIPGKKLWPAIAAVFIIIVVLILIIILGRHCPYQGETPAKTIINLIHAESEAVKKGDISIIKNIFAPDAIIRNSSTREQWTDPLTRYQVLFTNNTFIEAVHFQIEEQGITETTAHFTSGSRGKYYKKDNASSIMTYDNPSPSDEWTFGKNSCGCWVITSFTFR